MTVYTHEEFMEKIRKKYEKPKEIPKELKRGKRNNDTRRCFKL